jgi:hypothetical protein
VQISEIKTVPASDFALGVRNLEMFSTSLKQNVASILIGKKRLLHFHARDR